VVTAAGIGRTSGLSFPAASSAMNLLTAMGTARELTGKRQDRLFVYDGCLGPLSLAVL